MYAINLTGRTHGGDSTIATDGERIVAANVYPVVAKWDVKVTAAKSQTIERAKERVTNE